MMMRVGEEQDHACDTAIALLEGHPPLDGLPIADVRFGVDTNEDVGAVDPSVPGSEIDKADGRELDDRHLLAPAKRFMDSPA